ncbi:MAG: 50S ribosomal protein L19 [Candidatus Omnitrophica bacterium]|nr:50S ribosomal protein L19 [Candidatus Omnitrophota bacterium]
MDKIKEIEKRFMKKEIPQFNVGDTVKVSVRIKEGEKTRLQGFEGIVIGKKGSSIKETFTVRRVSYGEGIERVFQLHSPTVDSVSVIKKGKVNKAKLYYLRGRVGKHTKVEEKREAEKTTNAPVGKEGLS